MATYEFMSRQSIAILLVLSSYLISTVSAKSKYTDEERPYEFGFNIEGEQHRREKKDENGIIMGEFGFITADGVYHVTVYATDEEGNFKILSMKNIRLGPAPDSPPPNATPITEFITTTQAPVTQTTTQFTTPRPLQIASCSHCKIPSTTQKPPPPTQPPVINEIIPPNNEYQDINQNFPPNQLPTGVQPPFDIDSFQGDQPPQSNPQTFNEIPDVSDRFGAGEKGPYDTPLVISGELHTADPSVLNQPPLPGEREGPPRGITADNMSALLYRYNYTVGFHGHYEEGYGNGDKKGEYYVHHRNGLATKVSYVADEQGFRPKIETVRLSPEETPNPETETNPEYGLKGYEFKWFYVPKYHYLNRHT